MGDGDTNLLEQNGVVGVVVVGGVGAEDALFGVGKDAGVVDYYEGEVGEGLVVGTGGVGADFLFPEFVD